MGLGSHFNLIFTLTFEAVTPRLNVPLGSELRGKIAIEDEFNGHNIFYDF